MGKGSWNNVSGKKMRPSGRQRGVFCHRERTMGYQKARGTRLRRWFTRAWITISRSRVIVHSSWPVLIFTSSWTLLLVPQSSSSTIDEALFSSPSTAIAGDNSQSETVTTPQAIQSNYFFPTWTDQPTPFFSFDSIVSNPVGIAPIDANALAEDPSNLLEDQFKIPDYLKPRVVFWIRVYAQYDSLIRIVHDRNDLELVYGVIDLRPLHRQFGNTATFEIKAAQVEKLVLKQLKQLITEASSDRSNRRSTEAGRLRSYLSRFGALDASDNNRLCQNIRTQTGQRENFLRALHRAQQLLPHIESVLRQHRLPITLARIPFVESSFNVRAQSKLGAVGIWQFTPATAREWIHSHDDKFWSDPLRQTKSAASLLRGYRAALPDWSTTITSYNSGIGRLKKLTKKYRADSLEKLITVNDSNGLGFAGKNFFAGVMAATIVEAYKEKIFGSHLLPAQEREISLTSTIAPERCEYY